MTKAPVTNYQRNFKDTMPFSNTCMSAVLSASTALPWTVPGDSSQIFRAAFRSSFTAEVWVGYNVTATIPTSNTATATPNQEFIPLLEPKYVKGGDVLSFISAGTPSI